MEIWDKMKIRSSYSHVILLYGCTTWMLRKCLEGKLDGNYTRMLGAVFNKSKKFQPKKQLLYGHLPLILQTMEIRRIKHTGHSSWSKSEIISNVILRTQTHWPTYWPTAKRLYSSALCDLGYHLKDLPRAWCSRYRRRKWTRPYEFKSWTRLIAFHIALIPLGKVWIQ